MGRECGYLALVSAITCGAEVCIIPELDYDLESLGKKLKEQIQNGRTYVICIVAEGVKITNKLVTWLEKDVEIETRATILGYIQRGGNPTVYDRLMAIEFTKNAVDKLLEDDSNSGTVVVYKDSKFDFVSIDFVNSSKYTMNASLLELAKDMVK